MCGCSCCNTMLVGFVHMANISFALVNIKVALVTFIMLTVAQSCRRSHCLLQHCQLQTLIAKPATSKLYSYMLQHFPQRWKK